MSRWCEIVCDRCAAKGPGANVMRSAWAKLEDEARRWGWVATVTGTHTQTYLCPHCKNRSPSP